MLQSTTKSAEVLRQIETLGVLPIVRTDSTSDVLHAAEAIHASGITAIEITMTVPGALHLIQTILGRYGDDFLVGAGTVLDVDTARDCISAGASFIVGPALDRKVVDHCKAEGVVVMAGALTPSEILQCWRAGADAVKVFPCSSVGGPQYIQHLKGPFPEIALVPMGGVLLENTPEYIRAGACAVGVGTELIDLRAIREGNPGIITRRGRQFVFAVRNARNQI